MVDRLACAVIVVCALGVFGPVTAQEVKTSSALTEQMRSLQDELAKAVSAREASERAAADLRNKLTAAAQVARDGAVALELERARTEVAEEKLHALQAKVEQLEAAMAVEQALSASAAADAAAPALSPCALAAQGKVRVHPNGPKLWDAASLKRLCAGAGSSVEPARCYDRLMSGQVAWGGSSVWKADNALALCAGTLSATQTITCFRDAIALGEGWRSATQRCRHLGASVKTFQAEGEAEKARIKRQCVDVLRSPTEYDLGLGDLCRVLRTSHRR